jgi:hypothetical protein
MDAGDDPLVVRHGGFGTSVADSPVGLAPARRGDFRAREP